MKRALKWLVIGFVVMVGIAAIAGGGEEKDTALEDPAPAATEQAQEPEQEEVAQEESPEPTPERTPEMTTGQENALQAARSYIESGAFSKQGLIDQLSSEYGEAFSEADARFAANNVGADWRAEAVESAEGYMEQGGFSEQRLYEQLTSEYGEQFTEAQARYAVNEVYR